MDERLLKAGAEYQLIMLGSGRRFPVEKFLQDCEKVKLALHESTMALIHRIAENGPPRNTRQFRHERGKIYSIKMDENRILCFFDTERRNTLCLTHGFEKKQQRVPPKELDRADKIYNKYLTELDIRRR